ncbi:hypothetical protein BaRGS_00017418 [Batillaria attramentaria]|uniref:Amiloride-sensitive sodium channel n=1 Tax=Batillaria attramentaria TaxID=370345 RepID=A0ABD0KW30_9CAEN
MAERSKENPQAAMDKTKGGKNMRSLLTYFSEHTTMHGVVQIAAPGRSMVTRAIWVILVLAATGWSTYNVVLVISNYYEYPVSTITTVKFKGNLDFPAVSICNLNQVRKSKFENSTLSSGLEESWKMILDHAANDTAAIEDKLRELKNSTTHSYDEQIRELEKRLVQKKQDQARLKNRQTGTLRQMSDIRTFLDFMSLKKRYKYGHQLKKMLIGCTYQGRLCTNKQFQRFYNFHVGNCFTFNKKRKEADVSKPGPLHALVLVLDAQSEEYMRHSQTVGFKVVVHPQTDMPFPEDEGILISPGTATDIAVTQEIILRAPPPHGNCTIYSRRENLRRNMYAKEFRVGYTAQACQRTCYQKHTIKKCGCCDPDYPCPNDVFKHLPEDVNVTYCDSKETDFWEETSSGLWPSKAYVETLLETHPNLPYKDIDTIRENIVKVSVYFKQLNYHKVETVPAYNWYRLLSDIGGQLGLWVGFSVLTMAEVLQLLLDIGRHLVLRTTLAGHRKLSSNFRKGDGASQPL